MNANLMNATIEMTKTEATAAGKLNSEKFNELKALREMYPTFQIIVVKSTKKVDRFKGLTYEKMAAYITAHDDEEKSRITTFYELRGLDENGKEIEFAMSKSYGEIKMWFLTTYPEIENFEQAKRVRTIMTEVAKKRAEQLKMRNAA